MKITFLGAGSTVFAKNLLGDCLLAEGLAPFEIALLDIDAQRLEESYSLICALRNKINTAVTVKKYLATEPAQTEEEQVAVVEISEDGEGKAGESLRERISRERAERNAAARQSGGAIPRRRASDRRTAQEERNNIEIGERE